MDIAAIDALAFLEAVERVDEVQIDEAIVPNVSCCCSERISGLSSPSSSSGGSSSSSSNSLIGLGKGLTGQQGHLLKKPAPSTIQNMADRTVEFIWPDYIPHPLVMPDILKDIFGKLGMKELQICREVCSSWNQEACNVLQREKIVALMENEGVKYYLEKHAGTVNFPHSRFELHMDNIYVVGGPPPHPLNEFWNLYGANIRDLDIQGVIVLEALLSLIAAHLPNLETLSFKPLPVTPTRRNSLVINHPNINQEFPSVKHLSFSWFPTDESAIKSSLKELFRSFPNLETVDLHIIPCALTVTRENGVLNSRTRASRLILDALINGEIYLRHLNLLNFELAVGNAELNALTVKGYQFSKLQINVAEGTRSSALKDFLSSTSLSLRKLDITFPPNFFNSGTSFPPYLQMKRQEIGTHLVYVTELYMKNFRGSLSFVKNLWRLKRLNLLNSSFEKSLVPFDNTSDSIVGMTALRISSVNHGLTVFETDLIGSSVFLISISNYFPSLRILKISGVNDEGLGVIYRNLPFIQELHLPDGKYTDQGISGVPLEICEDMAETLSFMVVSPGMYRRDLFLGSLQYLQTLTLTGERVTDVSVAFGIVDCKSLTSLTMATSAVTDTSLMKIAERMSAQIRYMDLTECSSVTELGRFYAKEKMKGAQLIFEVGDIVPPSTGKANNPNRQIGYPNRGRTCSYNNRHLDREMEHNADEALYGVHLGINLDGNQRERPMDIRRRYFHHRWIYGHGRRLGVMMGERHRIGEALPEFPDQDLNLNEEDMPVAEAGNNPLIRRLPRLPDDLLREFDEDIEEIELMHNDNVDLLDYGDEEVEPEAEGVHDDVANMIAEIVEGVEEEEQMEHFIERDVERFLQHRILNELDDDEP